MTREQLIEYLVGNDEGVNNEGLDTPFAEDDRDMLENFSDEQLQATALGIAKQVENEEEEEVDNGKVTCSKKKNKAKPKMDEGDEEGTHNSQPEQLGLDQWMQLAPPEVQAVVRNSINIEKQQKDQLVAKIKGSPNCVFNEDQLGAMDLETLTGMAALIPSSKQSLSSYFGAQGSTNNQTPSPAGKTNNSKLEPLVLPNSDSLFTTNEEE